MMNRFRYFSIFILVLSLLFACNRNRLKTDDRALTRQIITENDQPLYDDSIRIGHEKHLYDSLAKLPSGFRFYEDRCNDPKYPPKIIDIEKGFQNRQPRKLSQMIEQIQYIPIENLNGQPMEIIVGLTEKYIIAKSGLSLFLFNRDGTLKDVICKEERLENSNFVTGVWGNVYTINNTLFYKYVDNSTKKSVLMSYDMDSAENAIPMPSDHENFQVNAKGKINSYLGVVKKERFNEYIPLDNYSYAGINSKTTSMLNGKLMTSFNLNGDTLCNFTDFETLTNYSSTLFRNIPEFIYQFNGVTTIYHAFSDTVFRVVAPNRLIPWFVFKFGKYRLKPNEGFNPSQDISTKLYITGLAETKKHVYFTLAQNFDSHENRKNKIVNIFYGIYEKKDGKVSFIPIDPKNYSGTSTTFFRQGIDNDIDGWLPFWPEKVNSNGDAFEIITAEMLHNYIESDQFINSKAPQNKKDELTKLAKKTEPNQKIVIIYK